MASFSWDFQVEGSVPDRDVADIDRSWLSGMVTRVMIHVRHVLITLGSCLRA